MVCTAGHVDHGKTRLVKMLTGCRTDRLKAEQERGMTIDLGFAPCSLGGDLLVGIVDVPGHERFIRNMVAGVSGIGLALLVIAADDGVMPQTVEHVRILELLGVRRGVVALTKTDLVDEETLEYRIAETREFLDKTFLKDAPICPVSSETFAGFPAFYETLVEHIRQGMSQARAGIFRMPVERTFSVPGHGQVVTGIPIAGRVVVGDVLELVPGGTVGKVRSIQRFGHDADSGQTGQCMALNIPDLGKAPIVRGQMLAAPGFLRAARFFHLQMRTVPELGKPLRTGEFVKWHAGTCEAAGRIFLLDRRELSPGEETLATVALDEPAVAAPHDRFILRRSSPAATVAGGVVLAVESGERRPRRTQVLGRLQEYRTLFAGVDPDSDEGSACKTLFCLRWSHPLGASCEELAKGTMLETGAVHDSLELLAAAGKVLALNPDFFIRPESLAELQTAVEERIAQAEKKGTLHATSGQLRGGAAWPQAVWSVVMGAVMRKGLARRRGDTWILSGAVARLPEADRALLERIAALYRDAGIESPRPEEVAERLKEPSASVEKMMRHLYQTGELVRLDKNVVFHYDVFRRAQDLAVGMIQERGALDSGDFKTALGTSRKYALAFLDFLDQRRVTIRRENVRVLTPDHTERLL
jgi:selenocysteine-specific elongation factor